MRSPIRQYASGSPISARRYSRATGRRRKLSTPSTRLRRRNGGPLSKEPGSRTSKQSVFSENLPLFTRLYRALAWLGREHINLPGGQFARVRYAPIADQIPHRSELTLCATALNRYAIASGPAA